MIIITNPENIRHEHKTIRLLFEAGLETLHVRKPDLSEDDISWFLKGIDMGFRRKIMIHEHINLVGKFSLKGVHFTEKSKLDIANYQEKKCIKSLAVHNMDDFATIPSGINYILFGPVFPSISKKGYEKKWDFSSLKKVIADRTDRSFKIIALGGITPEKVKEVSALGFDGYAVLGSIWEPLKAGKTPEEVLEIYYEFKKNEN